MHKKKLTTQKKISSQNSLMACISHLYRRAMGLYWQLSANAKLVGQERNVTSAFQPKIAATKTRNLEPSRHAFSQMNVDVKVIQKILISMKKQSTAQNGFPPIPAELMQTALITRFAMTMEGVLLLLHLNHMSLYMSVNFRFPHTSPLY